MSGIGKVPEVIMVDGDRGGNGGGSKIGAEREKSRKDTRPEGPYTVMKNNNIKAPGTGKGKVTSEKEKMAIKAATAIRGTPYRDITEATWLLIQNNMAYVCEYVREVSKEKNHLEEQLQQQNHTGSNIPNGIPPRNPTWASIIGSNSTNAVGAETASAEIKSQENRKAKALTIRIENQEQRKMVAGLTSEQIISQLKTGQLPNTQQIIAARELKSGDISLQMASVEAREALEKEEAWLKNLAISTKILKQSFPLLVHGVCIAAVDTTDQKKVIEEISRKNRVLHPGLEIRKITWPKWATREKAPGVPKKYSSLLIEVATAEMGNRILEEGLIEGSQLKMCVKYNRDGDLVQCFNCHKYDHMTMNCENPTKCGKCAGNHNTKDHPELDRTEICTVCKRTGHPAWSDKCAIRRQKFQKIQQKRSFQSTKFPTGNRIERPIDKGDGYTVVQKKRKAGEPIPENASTNIRPRVGRPGNSIRLLTRETNQPEIDIGSFTNRSNAETQFTGMEILTKAPVQPQW